MNFLSLVAYELRRILLTRACLYGLLLLLALSQFTLSNTLLRGVYGMAPYSPLSFAQFLVVLNPLLLAMLLLWCGTVQGERDRAVRRIALATPITPAGFMGIKITAIAASYLVISTLIIASCFGFYHWQFGFSNFGTLLNPLFVFWLPATVFVLGLGFAAGQVHPRLPLALLPLLLFTGVFNLGLPYWVDVAGNNFLVFYPKMLMRTLRSMDMVYYIPSDFAVSRLILSVAGLALLAWTLRRCSRLAS